MPAGDPAGTTPEIHSEPEPPRSEAGARHDSYTLRGKYPDVVIGAYITRLRRVVHDKQALSRRALGILGDAQGVEADAVRMRLAELSRKYGVFAELLDNYVPAIDGPVDLEQLLNRIPEPVLRAIKAAASAAWAVGGTVASLTRKKKR